MHETSSYQVPAGLSQLGSSHHHLSSAQQRTAALAQQRSAVQCRALPCDAVLCAMLCVLSALLYLLFRACSIIVPSLGSAWLISSAQLSSARTAALAQQNVAPCGAVPCRAVRHCRVLCRAALLYLHASFFVGPAFFCEFRSPFSFSCTKYDHTRSQLTSAWHISSAQLSSAAPCGVSSAQQRRAVP